MIISTDVAEFGAPGSSEYMYEYVHCCGEWVVFFFLSKFFRQFVHHFCTKLKLPIATNRAGIAGKIEKE